MNGSEEEFVGKIKTYLDRSAADLAPGVAYRLREMRTLALDRLDGYQEARQQALSAAGVHGFMSAGPRRHPRLAALTVAVGVMLLGVSVLGYQQWHAYQQIKEFEDLDAQILSSDLPIDAYLDTGFQAWLKTSTDN
jgi:hypothetical protein